MAHEIQSNDTVVLGSNTPAWHGLGKQFAGLLSPLRVFAEGVGARDIVSEPAVVNGYRFPSKKALFAVDSTGTKHPLEIVGTRYGVLQDRDFFEILEQVYQGRAVVETAGTLRGGRRVWALIQHDEFPIVPGDVIKTFDLWLNTHDGSSCYELHRTNTRVVCANTWRQAVGRGQDRVLGVPHRTNVLANAREAVAQLLKANEAEAHARAELRTLTTKAVSDDAAVALFRRLLEIPAEETPSSRSQKSLDTLVTLFRRGTGTAGRTAWDAFNAVTEFVDHHRTVRAGDRDRAEARFESSVFGNGDDLKAAAYDQLLTVN